MLKRDSRPSTTERPLTTAEQHAFTIRQISEMQLEDLVDLESDLEFYQKVPLIFLLGAHSSSGPQVVLQRLTVFHQSPNHQTNQYLQEWARRTTNWAPILVEALSIVRADFVLRRLGLDLDVIHEMYFARQPDMENHIHPIVKWLNHICEELTPAETRLLINGIITTYPNEYRYRLQNIPEPTERYLELWLLLWLSEGLIEVGDWEGRVRVHNRRNHCNVNPILRVLKTSDNAKLTLMHEKLQSAQIRFNCTSQNVIPKGKPKKGNEKDQQLDGEVLEHVQANGGLSKIRSTPRADQSLGQAEVDGSKYVMRKDRIGYALIINQVHFFRTEKSHAMKKPLEERLGSNYDRDKLVQTFSNLGYVCIERNNVTAEDTEKEITKVARQCLNSDSMVLCVLSHGFEGHVYSSDTVAMKITRLEQLISVPALVRKPKLLIIQACQGEDTQELMPDVGQLVCDGPTNTKPTLTPRIDMQLLRGDICIALSTGPGFASYRNTVTGSWFIQTLCKVINADYQSSHLVEMLTKVCAEVSAKRGSRQEAMITRTQISLCKHLYFPRHN